MTQVDFYIEQVVGYSYCFFVGVYWEEVETFYPLGVVEEVVASAEVWLLFLVILKNFDENCGEWEVVAVAVVWSF